MLRKQLNKGDENKYLETFNQAGVTGVFHLRIVLCNKNGRGGGGGGGGGYSIKYLGIGLKSWPCLGQKIP